MFTGENQTGSLDVLHILKCHIRLIPHHYFQRGFKGFALQIFRETGHEGILDKDICTAGDDGPSRSGIRHFKLKGYYASVTETEDGRFVQSFQVYEFLYICSHIQVVVFVEGLVGSLASGVESVNHITGLGKLAGGGFKLIVAASVSMQEDDGLATAFSGVEECGAVHGGGVGVATVWLAAYSQDGDGQEGEDCFLEMFHIDYVQVICQGNRLGLKSRGHMVAQTVELNAHSSEVQLVKAGNIAPESLSRTRFQL